MSGGYISVGVFTSRRLSTLRERPAHPAMPLPRRGKLAGTEFENLKTRNGKLPGRNLTWRDQRSCESRIGPAPERAHPSRHGFATVRHCQTVRVE